VNTKEHLIKEIEKIQDNDTILSLMQKLEKINAEKSSKRAPRKAGSAKGMIKMPKDFDEPLETSKDYR
jgi:hypothetical protein